MFYIKTADPLTRTATWLNKMEGGMRYLKAVVVEDVLGIGEELEREMQTLVNNFKCEWKEVVDNPELRKRFKERDPTVQFDTMRDQKRAKEWV